MQGKKKKKQKQPKTVRTGILATPERQNKLGGVKSEAIDRDNQGNVLIKRHSAISECVLDTYHYIRRYIDCAEYEAGLRFRKAYLRAVLKVRVDDEGSGAKDPEMAFLIVPISEQILRDAYQVLSHAQKRIVVDVCGHDAWAGNKDNIKTLRRGLEVLARHWRLI